MPEVFPETAGSVWRRTAVQSIPANAPPDPLSPTAIREIREATYQGPRQLKVRVYQLASSSDAFEAVQRWRVVPDKVFFYHDRYFVVLDWPQSERTQIAELEEAIQKAMGTVRSVP